MSNEPDGLRTGAVLRDSAGNVDMVERYQPEPTLHIRQVWAGGSKEVPGPHVNRWSGTWAELQRDHPGTAHLVEDARS